MKKLMILLLVAILAVSACFITACNPPVPPEGNTSSSDSSSDESSSDSKINISRPSYGNSSDPDSTVLSSSSMQNNESSINGSGVAVSSVSVDDTSTPHGIAMAAINMIGIINAENYIQKGQYILNAEEKCKLVSNLSLVENYSSLLIARAAYNNFYKQGMLISFFETLESLPSAVTEDNYTLFTDFIDIYDSLTSDQKDEIDTGTKAKVEQLRIDVDNVPKPATIVDFNSISGAPASQTTIFFSPTGFTTENTGYSAIRNSGSFSLTAIYGIVMAGSSSASKGLAVTSTNLTTFSITVPIERKAKIFIYFSRATGSAANYLTSVGNGFSYTGSGVAQSGTARMATILEVTSGADKVAVVEQTITTSGAATFQLASSSRVCVYKIVIQLM